VGEPIVVVVVEVVVVDVVVVAMVVVVGVVVDESDDAVVVGSGVAVFDYEQAAATLAMTTRTARRPTRMRSTDQS
jgi:hypothetical protein